MQWIFDHLNIVIIIALFVGSFLKSRFDARTQQAEEEEGDFQTPGEPGRPDASYRKGPPMLPSTPPPLEYSGSYSGPAALAAASEESARILKHQKDLAEHLRQIHESKAITTGNAAVTRARNSGRTTAKPMMASQAGIRSRLKNAAEVRRAMVLREILGSPVGLRDRS